MQGAPIQEMEQPSINRYFAIALIAIKLMWRWGDAYQHILLSDAGLVDTVGGA